ncbi:hypothetical protein H920_07456 [Fukomys damarensis]|uniref:Uncharacterized protein n=1 Tax=Fukomys damarensis TaxID=885580 RepID=A0A091DJB4_FUKDA|nr:hypothetical protein H920_07456 [Fukomys damarensis]
MAEMSPSHKYTKTWESRRKVEGVSSAQVESRRINTMIRQAISTAEGKGNHFRKKEEHKRPAAMSTRAEDLLPVAI